jgi:hypothetical protein
MAMTGIKVKSKPLDQVRSDVPVSEVTKSETVRLNMNVTKATRDEWKRAAIDLNKDVTSLIHEAMRAYLSEHLRK